jgi:hypothetical protein
MSTQSGGPNIITNSLVLNLDAANTKSYPGTGATWIDLSKTINNATLINSPTFNTSNGGSIVFNGSSNFANVPNISSYAPGTGDFAIEWWQYGGISASFPRIFSIGTYSSGNTLALSQEGGTLYFWINSSANGGGTSLGSLGTLTSLWSHFIVTRVSGAVRAYKNSIYLGTSAANTNNATFNNTKYFSIGSETTNGTSGTSGTFLGGRIASFRLYVGKGFTQDNVIQNFNATKTRFGL